MALSPHIEVVSPGTRLSVQDLGRRGSQRYGVSVSGVLDIQAACIANRLVGNPLESAVLEATFGGVSLHFNSEMKVAVCGAEAMIDVDGYQMPTWETIIVPAGSTLSVAAPSSGLYCYVAIAGGIDVPVVLGSRSTHIASEIGGYKGRILAMEDVIHVGEESDGSARPRGGTSAPRDVVPACDEGDARIRAMLGPQSEAFSDAARQLFFESTFAVSNLTDRQGARLDGAVIPAIDGKHDIVSDPAYMGAVQIPSDGKPIVLLADRQPTGGYAKIASVISADLAKVVQRPPGADISFACIDVDEAQQIGSEFNRSIREAPLEQPINIHVSNLQVNGNTYNVELVSPTNCPIDDAAGIAYVTIENTAEVAAGFELT